MSQEETYEVYERIIVSTNDGQIQGIKHKSPYFNEEFLSFYATPYAEPPIGNLRFMDPVKIKPWKCIRDATIEKDGCPQFSLSYLRFMGSEDCLYVNVHTSKLPSPNEPPKAVIALIHAGGLLWGSPDSAHHGSPNFIMNRDVVYVTIGYRINIFGFLNLQMKNCSGNQGIKDIIMALKWIKTNIKFFNGDPENVTLMGCSSGAAIVHLLMLLPAAKGLFHKAIITGNYLFNCLIWRNDESVQLAFDYGHQIGFQGNNVKNLLLFLKSLPAMTIVETMRPFLDKITKNAVKAAFGSVFNATIDEGKFAIIPTSPRNLIKSMHHVPLIFGICDRESLIAFTKTAIESTEKNFDKWYKHNSWAWTYALDDEEIDEIRQKIVSFYSDKIPEANTPLAMKEVILSDAELSEVYDTLINAVAGALPSSTYVYKFQYVGEMNASKTFYDSVMSEKFTGTYHFDDFFYWAEMVTPKSRDSLKMVTTMTKLFTNFAKTGNPNFNKAEVQWKPSTVTNPCHLSINETSTMIDGKLNKERLEFWDTLLKRYRKDQV